MGEEGAEVLIPIGAGSFVWGRVEKADKAIIGIGADVAIELDIGKARELIMGRIMEAEDALRNYSTRLAEVERVLAAYSERIRALMEAGEGAGGAEEGAKEVPG